MSDYKILLLLCERKSRRNEIERSCSTNGSKIIAAVYEKT